MTTDLDVLRTHHRFLHDDAEPVESYEAQVARKYYDTLYKEVRLPAHAQYAIANLKHFRTRGIALRWRTEEEVLDGIGQFTCANQRCEWHPDPSVRDKLGTYEVPFAYQEPGADGAPQHKQALVKLVLCDACAAKLHYRPLGEEAGREGRRTSRRGSLPSSLRSDAHPPQKRPRDGGP